MAVVLLISPEEFKERTPLNSNVDEKLLQQSILACQDIFVQNIIGTGLYNELKTQIQAATLTALNTTLLNTYLQPAMRYWIMAEIVRPLAFRYMNVGIQNKRTEDSNPISAKEMTETENHYMNRAEWYATRAVDYLCENGASYPLYLNPGSGQDIINPKGDQYTTTLFLGGVRKTKLPSYDEPYRKNRRY